MTSLLHLLADPTTQPTGPTGPAGGLPWYSNPFMLLILFGFIFYFMVMRPQSAERKRRQQMLTAIKKNDRVVTIGGVMGTVVLVKDDEITLKVDESNNTKITFLRSAIQKIVSAEPREPPKDAPPPPTRK